MLTLLEDEEDVMEDINTKMRAALVAMAEIYLTDEWCVWSCIPLQCQSCRSFAENAESECEEFLWEALSIGEQNVEALQTLASCRSASLVCSGLFFIIE